MTFHTLPCTPADFAWFTHYMAIPNERPIHIGDIVRLEEMFVDDEPTGRTLHRLVIRTLEDFGGSRVLVLVPLDHPSMQCLELTNPQYGTSVFWVGSMERFQVGTSIRMESGWWEILQACTSVAPAGLPERARVGFLAEGD